MGQSFSRSNRSLPPEQSEESAGTKRPGEDLFMLDATERQWKANQLAKRLQEASSSMRRVIDPKLLEVRESTNMWPKVTPTFPRKS
jgi:hypothetical protein